MTRKRDMVQVHLQLPKQLRAQLQRNADMHYTSLNVEIIDVITRALHNDDIWQRLAAGTYKPRPADEIIREAEAYLREHTELGDQPFAKYTNEH